MVINLIFYFVIPVVTGMTCGSLAMFWMRHQSKRGFGAGVQSERALWEARLADDGSGETLGQKRKLLRVYEAAEALAKELGVTTEHLVESVVQAREEIERERGKRG